MFVLGATAVVPQLNVWNQLDGDTVMESDEQFRNNILDGIGGSPPTIMFDMKPGSRTINVYPIKDGKPVKGTGHTIVTIKIKRNGTIAVAKNSNYNRHFYGDEKTGTANENSLMTDFLKAQATLIQELLATH